MPARALLLWLVPHDLRCCVVVGRRWRLLLRPQRPLLSWAACPLPAAPKRTCGAHAARQRKSGAAAGTGAGGGGDLGDGTPCSCGPLSLPTARQCLASAASSAARVLRLRLPLRHKHKQDHHHAARHRLNMAAVAVAGDAARLRLPRHCRCHCPHGCARAVLLPLTFPCARMHGAAVADWAVTLAETAPACCCCRRRDVLAGLGQRRSCTPGCGAS